MKLYVVRLNPDPREGLPYSSYPTVEEYNAIYESSPMEGFHEAVNFLPDTGVVKGYLPPRHLKQIRNAEKFVLLTLTAKTAESGGDKIVGIQAGCAYVGEKLRTGGKSSIKKLKLTYHYTCPETLSLLFDQSMANARDIVIEKDRYWGQGPTYELKDENTIKNVLSLAVSKKAIKKNNETFKKIKKYIESEQGEFELEITGESTFEDEVSKIVLSGKMPRTKGTKRPDQKEVLTYQYDRNPKVAAIALLKAKGLCGDCKKDGPFISYKTKMPFLEVHHVVNLKDGGDDTPDNVIALCPNCHRKRHYG
jgi:hypothetical protein